MGSADVCNLVDALAGERLDRESTWALLRVPRELRCVWMLHTALLALEAYLYRLADLALYQAKDGFSVCAFVDWSPFAAGPPFPVAEYHWDAFGDPHARIRVCEAGVRRTLLRCLTRCLPCVQISVYRRFVWNNAPVLQPQPLYMGPFRLLPQVAHMTPPA